MMKVVVKFEDVELFMKYDFEFYEILIKVFNY